MVRIYVESDALNALLNAAENDTRLREKVSAVRATVRSLPEPVVTEDNMDEVESDDSVSDYLDSLGELVFPKNLGEPYPSHENIFKTTI